MSIFKSLKYALPAALLLGATLVNAPSARAEWEPVYSSGGVTMWKDSNDANKVCVTIEQDGKFGVYFEQAVIDAVFDRWESGGNPNPDDPNNGKGTEKPDIESLLKKAHGAVWTVNVNPEDSPLGGAINGAGGGKVPHWNPTGDDTGGGFSGPPDQKPHGGMTDEQKAAIQDAIEKAARQAEFGATGMFDGSEGGSESWGGLNPHSGTHAGTDKGEPGKDDGKVDGQDYKDNTIPKGEQLGAKPEIVNPQLRIGATRNGAGKQNGGGQIAKHVVAKHVAGKGLVAKSGNVGRNAGKATKTSGIKTASGLSVMSPGLLEGGSGFAFNGPASAGSPVGSSHGTSLGGRGLR